MARTVLNPALRILSGNISDFTYRCYADGRIFVAKAPRRDPNRQPSPSQQAYRQRFKDASACYRLLLQDPATCAAYEYLRTMRGPRARMHALVIGDIMQPPAIHALGLSAYHGSPGDTILILARDNVAVARLDLIIRDLTTGLPVETAANALPIEQLAPTFRWLYTATMPVPLHHAVEVHVTACDLAGNKAEAAQVL